MLPLRGSKEEENKTGNKTEWFRSSVSWGGGGGAGCRARGGAEGSFMHPTNYHRSKIKSWMAEAGGILIFFLPNAGIVFRPLTLMPVDTGRHSPTFLHLGDLHVSSISYILKNAWIYIYIHGEGGDKFAGPTLFGSIISEAFHWGGKKWEMRPATAVFYWGQYIGYLLLVVFVCVRRFPPFLSTTAKQWTLQEKNECVRTAVHIYIYTHIHRISKYHTSSDFFFSPEHRCLRIRRIFFSGGKYTEQNMAFRGKHPISFSHVPFHKCMSR